MGYKHFVSRLQLWIQVGETHYINLCEKLTNKLQIICFCSFPVQTIFDAGDQGVLALALTPDARYLATISAGAPQVLCIWDWTIEGDTALCSATLNPSYGVQNFVLFNPDDTTQIVSNSDSQVIFYAWVRLITSLLCLLLSLVK